MSTRSVGIACLALAAVLAFMAAVMAIGGPSPGNYSQLLSRIAIFVAPMVAFITGMYLVRKAPTYY